jgi:hypothetical protein
MQIEGSMSAADDGHSWNISVRSPLHFASILVAPPAPVTNAFLTIETIVNYNCQLFPAPPSSEILFESLELKDSDGSDVPLTWQPVINHHECAQNVTIYDYGRKVALMFNSSLLHS